MNNKLSIDHQLQLEKDRKLEKYGVDIGLIILDTMSVDEALEFINEQLKIVMSELENYQELDSQIEADIAEHIPVDTVEYEITCKLRKCVEIGKKQDKCEQRIAELEKYFLHLNNKKLDKQPSKTGYIDYQEIRPDIQAHIKLEDLYAGQLKPAGIHRLKGKCPFHHERTASFYIYQEDNHYHCYGCGVHGEVINYYMETNKMTFQEALEDLITRYL